MLLFKEVLAIVLFSCVILPPASGRGLLLILAPEGDQQSPTVLNQENWLISALLGRHNYNLREGRPCHRNGTHIRYCYIPKTPRVTSTSPQPFPEYKDIPGLYDDLEYYDDRMEVEDVLRSDREKTTLHDLLQFLRERQPCFRYGKQVRFCYIPKTPRVTSTTPQPYPEYSDIPGLYDDLNAEYNETSMNETNCNDPAVNVSTITEPDPYILSYDPTEFYDGKDNPDYEPMVNLVRKLFHGSTIRKPKKVDRKFSSDYMDDQDWSFRADEEIGPKVVVKIESPDIEFSKNTEAQLQKGVDLLAVYIHKILSKTMRRTRKAALKNDTLGYVVKAHSDESDSSEERPKKKKKKYTKKPKRPIRKPKRFEVVSDSQEFAPRLSREIKLDSTSSEDSVPLSEEITTKRPAKSRPRNPGRPDTIMQSPGRMYKEGRDFRKQNLQSLMSLRRRLPHFLPKRYHWDPEEFGKLGYFWFNGPQGKNGPGTWKVVY